MIDVNKIVDRDVKRFTEWEQWENSEDFKDKVYLQTTNYNDNNAKLLFLYGVHKHVAGKISNHKCNKPQPCPEIIEREKQLFYVEQEVNDLHPNAFIQSINTTLLKKDLIDLSRYPEAGAILQSSMSKLDSGEHFRNVVDDLRLCIEKLVQQVLRNDKLLTNQKELLGAFLKDKGVSPEIRNMFSTLLSYYEKYQNENIKHNDNVIESEFEFIVNVSATFISFLANL